MRKIMNRYQKLAWFNLIVITVTIIITTAAIAMEIHWRGYSTIAPACIVILALMKLNPFLFKKPKGEYKVVSDERDKFIVKRAVSFAYTTFWIVLVLSSFFVVFYHRAKEFYPDDNIAADGCRRGAVHQDCLFSCNSVSVRPGRYKS